MDDLISRQTALEHLYGRLIESANNNVGVWEDAGIVFEEIATERLKRWIYEIPTIDPVTHGRWVGATKEIGWPIWKCSVCGGDGRGDYFVCPWCGTRMDEVTE